MGPDGKALGLLNYGSAKYPARLEKTDAEKVAPLSSAASRTKMNEAMREVDPKVKVAKLLALIHENAGEPYNAGAYAAMLGVADKAGLSEAEVRKHVENWTNDATPYGTEWATDIRSQALRALQDKKAFAGLATELALAAESALAADAPLDVRASISGMLARSARLAGKIDLADTTEAKVKELDAKLDEEYHKTVPPFKPETFAGRKNAKADRAVVMEIFTGAECPPCVGADVGFDALLKSYKPTEFIGLQYHLHIPGPDPLTNEDTVARQKYYGTEVRGTPTTFFEGKRAGGSGGLMQHAEAKYRRVPGSDRSRPRNPQAGRDHPDRDPEWRPAQDQRDRHRRKGSQERQAQAPARPGRAIRPLSRRQQAPVPPQRRSGVPRRRRGQGARGRQGLGRHRGQAVRCATGPEGLSRQVPQQLGPIVPEPPPADRPRRPGRRGPRAGRRRPRDLAGRAGAGPGREPLTRQTSRGPHPSRVAADAVSSVRFHALRRSPWTGRGLRCVARIETTCSAVGPDRWPDSRSIARCAVWVPVCNSAQRCTSWHVRNRSHVAAKTRPNSGP